MQRFSPFFLLLGALSLPLMAAAQPGTPSATRFGARPAAAAVAAAPSQAHYSSQLPALEQAVPTTLAGARPAATQPVAVAGPAEAAPGPGVAATAALAGKTQLLLVLLETLQAQQQQLAALRAQADAATRRANEAEAATVAFEQRLRQLESANARPSFWR